MKTIVEIEERINRLKAAKHAHANEIAKLEQQIEVINVELEKVLIEKGRVAAQERMKSFFEE